LTARQDVRAHAPGENPYDGGFVAGIGLFTTFRVIHAILQGRMAGHKGWPRMASHTGPTLQLAIDPRSIFFALEIVGVVTFALAGLVAARAHQMDGVGTFTVTFLSAFGGGTLRDLFLEQRPFYWVQHTEVLWLVLAMAALANLTLRMTSRILSDRLILMADAIGLGLFSTTGTLAAMEQGWPLLPCTLVGVIAATFGGVLRDIVCNEKPQLIVDPSPYASVAFAGNWLLLGIVHLAWLDEFWAAAAMGAAIAVTRVWLALRGVQLPRLN
jgi:uncharacterized membrane protein YeiH